MKKARVVSSLVLVMVLVMSDYGANHKVESKAPEDTVSKA